LTLIINPIREIPLIKPDDNLSQILLDGLKASSIDLQEGDILVVTQKIVSKAEDRLVYLKNVKVSQKAVRIAKKIQKDPRLVELILRESASIIRTKPGTIIVEHKLGFVCANAGIDHSNVSGLYGEEEDWVLLLPENPDKSAKKIRDDIFTMTGKKIGVIIVDSHGRAWRLGTVGVAIGLSGVPGLVDFRGKKDIFGYTLKATQIAAADELAAVSTLVMGEADERCPAVHVRGFPYPLRESSLSELIRPKDLDLFR